MPEEKEYFVFPRKLEGTVWRGRRGQKSVLVVRWNCVVVKRVNELTQTPGHEGGEVEDNGQHEHAPFDPLVFWLVGQ
jgi:hypothetical protein